MDVTWLERLDLFRHAIAAALVAGLACPLVGAFLWLRRTSFYGITLPQFAAAGVVFGFALLPWWIDVIGLGELTLDQALSEVHAVMNYLLLWAATFSLGGLLALVALGRRGRGSEIGRVAAAFAIANAATYLFGRLSPVGQSHVEELLHGEVLGVGLHELETIALVLGLVLGLLWLFRRELVLVSFDREFAQVLGKRTLALELLLHVLCAATVATGTMILGPTMLFGLLVLPPMAARAFTRSMQAYLGLSALLGVLAVCGGIMLSFEADMPFGASVVAVAFLELLPGLALRR
jgi:ABC-type Mn2+/Zn2+ transport system permease subunit